MSKTREAPGITKNATLINLGIGIIKIKLLLA